MNPQKYTEITALYHFSQEQKVGEVLLPSQIIKSAKPKSSYISCQSKNSSFHAFHTHHCVFLESPLASWHLIMYETILAKRNCARKIPQVLLSSKLSSFRYSTIIAIHIHLSKYVTLYQDCVYVI